MKLGTIYSASDKSLFDALNQKNVTNSDLRELFITRGILVSPDTTRRALALYFSRLTHDFADYQLLAKLFGASNRRDRMTSLRAKGGIELSTFESAAHDLKAELETAGASVRVTAAQSGRIDVEVRYRAVYFNKSEFRQVVSRTASIVIEKDSEGTIIHSPFNDDAKDWVADLLKFAGVKANMEIEIDEIRLPPALSVTVKNAFFARLIRALEGFSLLDVSDVYVAKPKPQRSNEDDDADEEETDTGIHISKASLKGEGVLQSEELKLLAAKNFYISKIVWTAKRTALDSDIYEFEAQFSDSDRCSDFTYLPRGFYKYQGPNQYNETRTGFSKDEEQRLGKVIEAAARKTLKTLPGGQSQ